jgi:hypothetical protein
MVVLQVSAIGVWGDPLTLALRAADLVVALPPSQQGISRGSVPTVGVYAKVLAVLAEAGRAMLAAPGQWVSPYVSRDELQGKCMELLLVNRTMR